ncbi:YeeE/YedE thiosulfate transporter family protein [Streptobacillus felis]|uniref:YeeE/YedE family protein n=1 Tax=Streptobacillus felis TaxID=1384509 RepID=A0A7Z0PEL0_9FUSO|nr:YeeE/YedE thiosulfate transporter family protein [Streptobacillus felis]NYV27331.1 YeeE/YedE family protein [Streptobacillus felis]
MEDRKSRRKEKPSQIPYALILLACLVGFGFYLKEPKLVLYWIFGLAFGIILQRSRFCFTAAFRDPVLTGGTSITRSVLWTISLATVGFTAYKYINQENAKILMANVYPISILTVVGAILFGIGMVIAGGCASGTLMRFGEGFEMQWLSFVFFVFGSVIGAWAMSYLEPATASTSIKVFLPDVFGWVGALVVQFIIILSIYVIALKWQLKKIGSYE